jgi:hypothetical protein
MPVPRLLLLLALAGCGPTPRGSEFRDRLLAVIPEQSRVTVPVAFSRDGRHAAYVERIGTAFRAVRNGWKSPEYRYIC